MLRIKLDENLPTDLVPALASMGHDVETVPGEGLASHPDRDIEDAARAEGRFLVTQDLDFSDRRRFLPGTHPGILVVRLRVPGARALLERVSHVFRTEAVDSWSGAFVVATDTKIRATLPTTRPGASAP